jgi:hypothetical protein
VTSCELRGNKGSFELRDKKGSCELRVCTIDGDIDFIPSEEYTQKDAKRAIADAVFVVQNATSLIPSSK